MTEESQPDLNALLEGLNSLGDSIKEINEKVSGFEEQFANLAPATPQEPVTTPVDPNNDPRKAPPQDWGALRDEIEQTAAEKAEAIVKAKEDARQKEIEENRQNEEKLNKTFDQMADEAVTKGFIPAITNQDDPDDAGKAGRRELFGYAAKLGTTNLLDVAENLKTLNEQGIHYDVKLGKLIQAEYRPQGMNVPVGSSANRTGTPQGSKIDPMTIKRMSLDQLAKMAMDE